MRTKRKILLSSSIVLGIIQPLSPCLKLTAFHFDTMSASMWKSRLRECQGQLADATTSATEWREVATNRLQILHFVDQALTSQIEGMKELGEVFGVCVDMDPEVWRSTENMDANGTGMYLMGKIEAASFVLRDILQESASVQSTLEETYALACKATGIERPQTDIRVNPDLTRIDVPGSPLKDLASALNDELPPTSDHKRTDSVVVLRPRPEGKIDSRSATLNLFKR